MKRVLWFKDIHKDDIEKVGGKGANLGEMFNSQFPIPEGFVVTAGTYKEFIEKTGIKEKILEMVGKIDVNNTEQLQNTSKQIRELIATTSMPEEIKEELEDQYMAMGLHRKSSAEDVMSGKEEFVAVRSSATAEDLPEASFAGQQATFLNIKGKENIVKAVQNCWASLYTARAVYYRTKNDFPHDKVFIAVVVQRMVNSDSSGVMFTINPSNNNDKEVIIEGALGLGEAVVSGMVTPDLYIVNKEDFSIKSIEKKTQKVKLIKGEDGGNVKVKLTDAEEATQAVNEKHIVELAKYGVKIEKHYGVPQDLEWAIERDHVYIVQSRAITTFKKKDESTEEEKDSSEPQENKKILLKGQTASAGVASGKVKIIKDIAEISKVKKGDILVTIMTNPDMVPIMQKASAIITDDGGMTSHAAIVSREMGIPCIVGTDVGTEVLKDDMIVTVDATKGIVFEGEIKIEKPSKETIQVATSGSDIVTATDVKTNVDIPSAVDRAIQTDADGVGLVRLEFIIADGGKHPAQYIREDKDDEYTELLYNGIKPIVEGFKGKPVWIRCSDIRTDEYKNLEGGDKEEDEANPMLGWHAIRRLLDEPRILKAELKAIKKLHDEGFHNAGIMLPFVINTSEVRDAMEIACEIGVDLEKIDFGVMIETPASCWIIEDMCRLGIKFVSFGTNDLTQTTLGIDRNNSRLQNRFSEMHPAVLGQIGKVIKTCKKYNVKTSICGQAGSMPEMVEFLVHQGIDSISANIDAVGMVRKTVAKTERKILLEKEICE